ncbi:hypothetical protein MIAR_01700 [Microbacterium arabinogalactanolyticum]|jgi:hypothetical protein|uniref:Uncharacterized protein n=1 Tax=Microbacterium arabinogalactanolyticum TaxID=69365 RepID=A0ABQ5ND66_9MICO|nr:hypothetical protein MIAR_01700 [Microbacterium arabinogalactanolyticum]
MDADMVSSSGLVSATGLGTSRLHDGEPIELGPVVATKEKTLVKHG